MKPIQPINKTIKNRIKNKYWSHSLYVIEEEYVPSSLMESLPPINEDEGENMEPVDK